MGTIFSRRGRQCLQELSLVVFPLGRQLLIDAEVFLLSKLWFLYFEMLWLGLVISSTSRPVTLLGFNYSDLINASHVPKTTFTRSVFTDGQS